MRLWTGKSVAEDGRYIDFSRRCVDLHWDRGLWLSYVWQVQYKNQTTFTNTYHGVCLGAGWPIQFGYFVEQYDGWWKSLWIGPFSVSWYASVK